MKDARPAAKARARIAPLAASGETVTVHIGTMPAGKSIKIRFRVTVNSGVSEQISNQGTVSGTGISVLTDDTSVGGAADPTVTPVAATTEVSIRDSRVTEPAASGTLVDMLFTVVLSRSPAAPVSVSFATADGTATGGGSAQNDYVSTSGTLNFAAGQRVRTIAVPVRRNAPAEPDEGDRAGRPAVGSNRGAASL